MHGTNGELNAVCLRFPKAVFGCEIRGFLPACYVPLEGLGRLRACGVEGRFDQLGERDVGARRQA